MGKNRKGQAAMEYLMTYGWAILVLVIVLAALWYLLPSTQEQCIFQQGVECEGGIAQIYIDDNGELFVAATLHNKFGQTIDNVKVLCTDMGKGDVDSALFEAATNAHLVAVVTDSVGPGASFVASDVPCVKWEGTSHKATDLVDQVKSTEGAGFKGVLAIQYSLDSDPNPNKKHVTTGTVSGTIIK